MFTFTSAGRLTARNIRFEGRSAYSAGCQPGIILASTGNQFSNGRLTGFYCDTGSAVYLNTAASGTYHDPL
jgi:hypothetical protein